MHSNVAGITIRGNGHVVIKNNVGVRTGVIINLSDGAEVSIGQDTFLNDRCILNARKEISIGSRVQIGQNVLMYDHDHDYHNLAEIRTKFITDEIVIGNDVWIGSNCVILRGSKIGDRCVIGAGTVIKGEIPSDSIVYSDKKLIIKQIVRGE